MRIAAYIAGGIVLLVVIGFCLYGYKTQIAEHVEVTQTASCERTVTHSEKQEQTIQGSTTVTEKTTTETQSCGK